MAAKNTRQLSTVNRVTAIGPTAKPGSPSWQESDHRGDQGGASHEYCGVVTTSEMTIPPRSPERAQKPSGRCAGHSSDRRFG
jgi:hypothetical protein